MDRSHKLSSFEGLRGVAAFVVVVSHLRITFFAYTMGDGSAARTLLPDSPAAWAAALGRGLTNGSFAVWLFWIMSAFVLSLQFFLRASRGAPDAGYDYLEQAFLRRYPRLFVPVFASICLAYVLMRLGLMSNLRLARYLGEAEAAHWLSRWYTFSPSLSGVFKTGLWDSFFHFGYTQSYNNVLWTMEKEYYGSLFLFGFLALLGRRRCRFLVYPAAFVALHLLKMDWLNAFLGGIALCDVFVNREKLGPLAGVQRRPGVLRLRESPGAAAACWLALILGVGHGWNQLVLGLLAIALTVLSTPTRMALSRPVPMFLGKISFGLYLVHVPLICSFSCSAFLALVGSLGRVNAALLASAATCALSVALGSLFTIAFDQPAIRLSRTFAELVTKGPGRFPGRSAVERLLGPASAVGPDAAAGGPQPS